MASTTPTRLDNLPAEIIKRIASFSPTPSVLALLLVNRRLRGVCNDDMVFKSIIFHHNNEKNDYVRIDEQNYCIDWSPPPTTEYARYALADFRARAWSSLSHDWNPSESTNEHYYRRNMTTTDLCSEDYYQKAMRWAPKLASLHHPFIKSLDIKECIEKFSPDRSDAVRLGLHFILTTALLAQLPTANFRGGEVDYFEGIKDLLQERLTSLYPLDQNPDVAMIALSLFIFIGDHGGQLFIKLPLPFKIPFPRHFLPDPFSEITCQDLTSSHLQEMTSKSYLEEGEWVGYYSYGSHLDENVSFDPPMTGMHFSVVPVDNGHDTNAETNIMQISAHGRDKVGTFSLKGSISNTGEVKCKKTYDTGSWWWDWNARMTPFGIVGNWGRNEAWEEDGQGCVWLWKRDWCK